MTMEGGWTSGTFLKSVVSLAWYGDGDLWLESRVLGGLDVGGMCSFGVCEWLSRYLWSCDCVVEGIPRDAGREDPHANWDCRRLTH